MKTNQLKSKDTTSQAPKQMEQQKKETRETATAQSDASRSMSQRRSVRFDVV